MKANFLSGLFRRKAETKSLSVLADSQWLSPQRATLDYYEGWVYACVNKIAKGFAQIEWKLYQGKNGNVKELFDHPLLSLLYKFNDKMTKFDSLELTGIYYTLHGQAPWILTGEGKTPDEIWVAPPTTLTPMQLDARGYPASWRYMQGTDLQTIPAENVLNINNPNPAYPARGMGMVEAVRLTADTDRMSREWNKNLLENHAQPAGVVELDGSLDPKEIKNLRRTVEEMYGGYENAHKIVILQNGAKLKPFAISPTDLDFIRGREFSRDEILSIFGVPKILLGLEGGQNRATAEIAELVFAKYTLQPILRKIVEQINEFLTPRFGTDLWLDFDSLVPEDTQAEIAEYTAGWNKWLTTNEIRSAEGLPELTGGDVIYGPLMSVPTVGVGGEKNTEPAKADAYHEMKNEHGHTSARTIKNDKAILRKIYARNNKLTRLAKEIADGVEKSLEKKQLVIRMNTPAPDVAKKKDRIALTDEQKIKWWNASMEYKRKLDGSWQTKMEMIFDNQRKIILDKLEASGVFKAGTKKKKIDELLFDKKGQTTTTMTVIKPEYYNSLLAGATISAEAIGEQPIDILAIPKVKDWLDYVTDKYATSITGTTYDDVYKLFQTAFDEGQSNYEVRQNIEGYFDNVATYRADMIARTESARALTASQGFTFEEYGFTKVEWYAEPTACELCLSFSMDDKWTVEDAQQGTVEFSHPNCECRFLPV